MLNNQKQAVFDYLDRNKDVIVEYLRNFISIPSINYDQGGNEEKVQNWLFNEFKGFGFCNVDKFAVDAEQVRPNVVAVMKGSGKGRSIIFNGHTDVVPVAKPDTWCCDPFKPIIKDGKVFGRGASDMKGGLSSAIWAMKGIKDCGIKLSGDVILQAVTGEESNQAEDIGTVQCLKRGYTADFAVVCEPSDLELHICSAACFMFELIVEGKGVHASARNQVLFPQTGNIPSGPMVGVDALKKSLPYINYFYSLEEQWNHRWRDSILGAGGKAGHDVQGVGIFVINPSFIEGGEHGGSVPQRVKCIYNVHYPDRLVKKEAVWEEIRKAVHAISSTDDFLKENPPMLSIPTRGEWEGFKVSEDDLGVQTMASAIFEATGKQAVISGFKTVCDATYLNKHGIHAIVFGPGSLSCSAHGDNEHIYIKDLITAAKVYANMMIDWCS